MISQKDLEKEIRELENAPESYRTYEKLAVLRAIYNDYYAEPEMFMPMTADSGRVARISETEFSKAVEGVNTQKAWELMDELMTTLQVINPRLYNSVMRKINEF